MNAIEKSAFGRFLFDFNVQNSFKLSTSNLQGDFMSIPRNKNGAIDHQLINKIYIVYDINGVPLFVVAITTSGHKTETATANLINEIKSSNISYEESTIEEHVLYYHFQEYNQEPINIELKIQRKSSLR